MKKTISILRSAGVFAEDKDIAAELRESVLRPALAKNGRVILDFKSVEGATQSFVHAMTSDIVRKLGPSVLERIEFKNCNESIKGIVSIVVEYSQLDVELDEAEARQTAK